MDTKNTYSQEFIKSS